MPQETQSKPVNPDGEQNLGVEHENLEGWTPDLKDENDLRTALEKAFDYRGDITLTKKDGTKVEGYVFDRTRDEHALQRCVVRMMPKDSSQKIAVCYSDVAKIEFTGKDTAAGKSFETWLKKYMEKKAAGEKNISLEPEKLD